MIIKAKAGHGGIPAASRTSLEAAEYQTGTTGQGETARGQGQHMRIFKVLLFLGVMGFVFLAAYAYIGDLSPDPQPVRVPVALDGTKADG